MAIELPLHSDPALAAAFRTHIETSSPADESFVRLTGLAARLLNAPGAFISLAYQDTHVCRSCTGLPESWKSQKQLALVQSLLGQVYESGQPLAIDDVQANAQMRKAGIAQPLLDELHIGACLAVPLATEDGRILGVIGVVDARARRWTSTEVEALGDLATAAACEIEMHIERAARRQAEALLIEASRKHDEEMRSDGDSLYRYLYENNPHPMFIYDIDTLGVVSANDAACRQYGYSREEFEHLSILDLQPAAKRESVLANVRAIVGPLRHPGRGTHARKDGTLIEVEVTTHDLTIEEHAARLVLALDITERVRSEEGLRRQKEILQTIFDHIPVMVAFFDSKGQLQLVNRHWEQTLGWTLAEAQQAADILGELYPQPEAAARVRDFIANPTFTWTDFATRVRDGSTIDTSWIQMPLSDGTGICLGLNVTDKKKLESQLMQAQKMEAVGRLAGGVAHDFNNMLTIVLGQCDLAAWTLSDNDPMNERIREIRKAGERAAALTRQLLIFSRKQVITTQLVDLGAVIESVDRMMRRVLGEDIELTTLQNNTLWPIFVDPGQMEQVIINLIVNARDAMPEGGRLTIETQNVTLDQDYCRLHPDATPGDYVRLSVRDTGIGIEEKNMEKIFEPFFTTKEEGKGTGLGLATVYGIVRQSGGHIEVESKVKLGAAFRIYLPRAVRPEAQAVPQFEKPKPKRGSETILLVEDNELVRDLAKSILEQYGYRVYEAANGEEALSLYEREQLHPDLLLTDVVMPAMGGRQLAENLIRQRPDLKVLYLSGYTDDSILRHKVSESRADFLHKPFTPESLAFKVREVLDSTGTNNRRG